jgi:hypothetical protein
MFRHRLTGCRPLPSQVRRVTGCRPREAAGPAVPVTRQSSVSVSPRPTVPVPGGPAVPVPGGPAVPVLRLPPPGPPRPAGEPPPRVMVWPGRRGRVGRRGLRGSGDGGRHGDGGLPRRPGVMTQPRKRGLRPRCRCGRRGLRSGLPGLLGRGGPRPGWSAVVRRQVDGYRAADDDRRHGDQRRDSGAEADLLEPGVHGRVYRRGPAAAGPMTWGNHKEDHIGVSLPRWVTSAIPAAGVAPARLAWQRARRERWTA